MNFIDHWYSLIFNSVNHAAGVHYNMYHTAGVIDIVYNPAWVKYKVHPYVVTLVKYIVHHTA